MKKNTEEDAPLGSPSLDLQGAVQELAAPAYVIDREGLFRWLNPQFVELIGDRRGEPFVDVVAPEHRQLARTNFARKIVGKGSTIFDVRVMDRHGGRVTLRVSSAPLRRAGAVIGVFGIGIPVERGTVPRGSRDSLLDDLTPRQLEVLRLLSDGLETQEIAARLGIAEETARNHIRALLRTTGAHSRLEAVVMGIKLGLLGPQLTQLGQEAPDGVADE